VPFLGDEPFRDVQDVRQVLVAGRRGRFGEAVSFRGSRHREAGYSRRDRVRVGPARAGRANRGAMPGGDVVRAFLQTGGTDDQGAEARLLDQDRGAEEDENPSQHDGGG
jgi:hypothetical protein